MFNYLLAHSPLVYFTQSFWRDEAFSVLFAKQSIWQIVVKSSSEPPLYYILLHFWMKLFGANELAVRSLSLLGFTCTIIVIIYLSEYLFKKHWVSWVVPILCFINPMLLIYAFEARAYGWYMFFATLVMYAYLKKNWKLFIIASVFGIYTHLYMVFVPCVCLIHAFLFTPELRTKKFFKAPVVQSFFPILICITPWFIYYLSRLSNHGGFWYFPVDTQLMSSVLGNMYTGYDGTPWFLWPVTRWISLVILVSSVIAWIPKNTRKEAGFFLCMVFLPLTGILGISLIQPLFVNRYLIPVTIAEIFVLGYMIQARKTPYIQIMAATACVIGTLWFTCWFPMQHPKMDMRTPMTEIQSVLGKNDVIYADDALVYFETMYYAKDKNRVFIYNPSNTPFPWYIGDSMFNPNRMAKQLPQYPAKAFIIHTDGSYTSTYLLPMDK